MTIDAVRRVAPLWHIAYGVVHAWWVFGHAPRFLAGRESYFPGGWVPVLLGAGAALGCVGVTIASHRQVEHRVHHVLAGINAIAGAGLCLYSFLFPVVAVSLVFEGVGTGSVWSLLATGGGVVGGVLCLVLAADQRRLATGSCHACGRIHGRSPESREETAPRWAFAGAYLAVAGYAARTGVWAQDAVAGRWPSAATLESGTSRTGLAAFLVLMSLAGTLLPLALVHRFGRVWPTWTGPVRGRATPRWLVLGPGIFVGAGMTAYFGIAGMTAWIRGDISGPSLPLMVMMGGYTVWGVGLLVACGAFAALTRPPCPRALSA